MNLSHLKAIPANVWSSLRGSRNRSSPVDVMQGQNDEGPLQMLSDDQLRQEVNEFVEQNNLNADKSAFLGGAFLAQRKSRFREAGQILYSAKEIELLNKEIDHPYLALTGTMLLLAVLCSGAAFVQGMDQSIVNGAQLFYEPEFYLNELELGFVNGAPYIAAAIFGCWLNRPINNWVGRRGTTAICCACSSLTAIGQATSISKWMLFAFRLVLHIGIGAKSSTTPIWVAETAPPSIRGAMTMMWQMWTAFGIAMGNIIGLPFWRVAHNWRLMLGVTGIVPALITVLVWRCPESPKWYMKRGKYQQAYDSFRKLRSLEVQAARDFWITIAAIKQDNEIAAAQTEGGRARGKMGLRSLWTDMRTRRALFCALFAMFMQQFCGVNVIAYYSSTIFIDGSQPRGGPQFKPHVLAANGSPLVQGALLMSMGAGLTNWLFAFPAFLTIDKLGRRTLLLWGYLPMAASLLLTGGGLMIDNQKTSLILAVVGVYLFMAVYSPTAGPVPYTYAAEVFPLPNREYGMAAATSLCWFFNAVLAITWPAMKQSLGPLGAFGFYAGWNVVAFIVCFLFFPETKGKKLEELDVVFEKSFSDHARWQLTHLRNRLRNDKLQQEPLYVDRRGLELMNMKPFDKEQEHESIVASDLHRVQHETMAINGKERPQSNEARLHRVQQHGEGHRQSTRTDDTVGILDAEKTRVASYNRSKLVEHAQEL